MADEVKPKKKRGKKVKKQKIVISLWINKTKYEHGCLCTFCAKVPAICHCPDCPDFYCNTCDISAHATKKRKDHIRTDLSKLTLTEAAGLVTRITRNVGHLKSLQNKCREKITRHFDKVTLNYYYFNPVYKTVSWRKPYCLRLLPLKPFMGEKAAANICQTLYHAWVARDKARQIILRDYRKVFDRKNGEFYYSYNGVSNLVPKQSWRKHRLLGKRSFPKDLLPIYTIDVAALIIQRKWRAILVRSFLRALVRAAFDEIWDPVDGKYTYYHRDGQKLYNYKPKILRQEPWDPKRIPEWSKERVSLFLRRIGLKRFADKFFMYEVTGKVLLTLDDEDFENMQITDRIAIKKIIVEMGLIYKTDGKVKLGEEHFERRERIRRLKMYSNAALMCQKTFRGWSARRIVKMKREIIRIDSLARLNMGLIADAGVWWTENPDIMSNKLTNEMYSPESQATPGGMMAGLSSPVPAYKGARLPPGLGDPLPGTGLSSPQQAKDSIGGSPGVSNLHSAAGGRFSPVSTPGKPPMSTGTHSATPVPAISVPKPGDTLVDEDDHCEGVVGAMDGGNEFKEIVEKLNGQVSIVQLTRGKDNGAFLPPIPMKSFGRFKDHLSCDGWGRYKGFSDISDNFPKPPGTTLNATNVRDDDRKTERTLWLPLIAAQNNSRFTGDSNPTKLYTVKLSQSGYDARRADAFNAEHGHGT